MSRERVHNSSTQWDESQKSTILIDSRVGNASRNRETQHHSTSKTMRTVIFTIAFLTLITLFLKVSEPPSYEKVQRYSRTQSRHSKSQAPKASVSSKVISNQQREDEAKNLDKGTTVQLPAENSQDTLVLTESERYQLQNYTNTLIEGFNNEHSQQATTSVQKTTFQRNFYEHLQDISKVTKNSNLADLQKNATLKYLDSILEDFEAQEEQEEDTRKNLDQSQAKADDDVQKDGKE